MLPIVLSRDDLLLDYNSVKNGKGFASSEKSPVWWKCHVCGFEWVDKIDRRFRGAGCPKCNEMAIRRVRLRNKTK